MFWAMDTLYAIAVTMEWAMDTLYVCYCCNNGVARLSIDSSCPEQ